MLQAGLEANFAEVQVKVVECPDLTKEPFQFPVKGTTFFNACKTVASLILSFLKIINKKMNMYLF